MSGVRVPPGAPLLYHMIMWPTVNKGEPLCQRNDLWTSRKLHILTFNIHNPKHDLGSGRSIILGVIDKSLWHGARARAERMVKLR